jgi:hypothetical protein
VTVTSTNLIQGPATLYQAAFGTAEPVSVATVPAAPWVDLGGTQGGIELMTTDTYSVLDVDQIIYEVERRRTKRVVHFKTILAEATLTNLAIALNNTAPTAGVFTPDDGLVAFNPPYGAVILDGIAPGGFKRRLILRKVLSTDVVGMAYKKDGQTLVPVTFTAHWISSSIRPYVATDATS